MFTFGQFAMIGLMFGATAAYAGDIPQDVVEGANNACRADYHRICPYVVPGDGRATRCLLDHQEQIEPECMRALKMADAIWQCTPDYHRFCEGAPRGFQAFECLASRMDALLPQCRRIIAANAPYMRYRDNRYGYSEPYPPRERYAYGGREDYSYRENPYGAEPQPQPQDGSLYSSEQERFRPDGYPPQGYGQRGYNYSAPSESYEGYQENGPPR